MSGPHITQKFGGFIYFKPWMVYEISACISVVRNQLTPNINFKIRSACKVYQRQSYH